MNMTLFDGEPAEDQLATGAVVLRGFALSEETPLLSALGKVIAGAPLRHMITPGGFRMSVAMTNCGPLGWVTDRTGYRYSGIDPETNRAWPEMTQGVRK